MTPQVIIKVIHLMPGIETKFEPKSSKLIKLTIIEVNIVVISLEDIHITLI